MVDYTYRQFINTAQDRCGLALALGLRGVAHLAFGINDGFPNRLACLDDTGVACWERSRAIAVRIIARQEQWGTPCG